MFKYSQLSPLWSRKFLGKTKYTIKLWGCLICSICTMLSDNGNGVQMTPGGASRLWRYLTNGALLWSSIKFPGLAWVSRVRENIDHKTATEYINDDKKGVVLEVNGIHWVYPVGWFVSWLPYFLCVDPNTYNSHTGEAKIVLMRKSGITGYSLFHFA